MPSDKILLIQGYYIGGADMRTNGSVTIYNAKKTDGQTIYTLTQINDVSIKGADQVLFANQNTKNDDEYIIRIPQEALNDKKFVDKNTYKSLPADEAANYWTVQKGDYIVFGLVEDTIKSPKDLMTKYEDDVLRITVIRDNRDLSGYTAHIKVIAK